MSNSLKDSNSAKLRWPKSFFRRSWRSPRKSRPRPAIEVAHNAYRRRVADLKTAPFDVLSRLFKRITSSLEYSRCLAIPEQLSRWIEDNNGNDPHEGLNTLTPRQVVRLNLA